MRKVAQTKKIQGRWYDLYGTYGKLSEAHKASQQIRANGGFARVVENIYMGGWVVYKRRQRRHRK